MLFELRNVSYTYLRGTPFETEALRGLSLVVPENQTTALVGPTQSGKSTVVDLLAVLMKPTAGTLLFEGDDVASPSFDIERIRSQVGIVFQSPEAQIFGISSVRMSLLARSAKKCHWPNRAASCKSPWKR